MNPDDLMMFLQNAAGGGNTGNSTPSAASASAPSASPSSPAPPMPAPPPLPSSSPDLYSLAQPTGGQVPQLGPPQLPQQQQRIQGVKGYLSNFLYGVGESLKASAGLETDAQRQQRIYNNDLNQRKFSLEQAQTQAAIGEHLARVQQMQSMVTIMGPNGPMQVPYGIAKPYIDAWGKQQAALVNKRFVVVPNVGVLDTQAPGGPQLAKGTAPKSVTITPDMVTYNGIPEQLIGQDIPIGQFAQLERGGAAFAGTVSNTTENIPLAGGKIGQVPKTTTTQKVSPITGRGAPLTPPAGLIDPATGTITKQSMMNAARKFMVESPNSPTGFRNVAPMSGPPQTTTPTAPSLTAPRKPVNMSTRGGVKILTDNNGNPLISKSGEDTGYAFDPQTNENVITTRSDADQKGYLNFNKANPAQVSSDMRMNNQLGDVAQKITRYETAVVTSPLPDDDRNKIAYLINSDKFKANLFGASVPVDEINTFLKQHQLGQLSQQGVTAFNAYLQARESLVGYNRILSGSSRSNEKQLELLLQALPDPTQPQNVVRDGINQFKENIHIAGNGLPRIPGLKRWSEYFNGGNGGGTVAPEGTIVQTGSGKQIKQGGKWVPYNQ